MVSYWIGYGTNYIGGITWPGQSSAAWRIPFAIQLVPAIVLCIGSWFLPYSPRWLMLVGKEEESLVVLAGIREQDPNSPELQYEYLSLKTEAYAEREASKERYGIETKTWCTEILEYKRILTTKVLLHRVGLGAGVQAFGQWSGKPARKDPYVVVMELHQHISNLNRHQCNYLLRSNCVCASRSLWRNHRVTGHWSSRHPDVRLHNPKCSYGR